MSENFESTEPEGSSEGGSGGGQYVSKKDIKLLGIILVVFFAVSTPVWFYLKGKGEQSLCSSNINKLASAVILYAESNDGFLPPVYYEAASGEPVLYNGHPMTWASAIQPDIPKIDTFKCPTAKPEEHTLVAPFVGQAPIRLSYGMYAPLSLRQLSSIENPSINILIAETSNNGSKGTYQGEVNKDFAGGNNGFMIGPDTSNDIGRTLRESDAYTTARAVTHLAFAGITNNDATKGHPRHDGSIWAVTSNRTLIPLRSPAARIQRRGDDVLAPWSVR